jgi:hypothetical protein
MLAQVLERIGMSIFWATVVYAVVVFLFNTVPDYLGIYITIPIITTKPSSAIILLALGFIARWTLAKKY